jgi:FMN phosphatase YigB (HAD superfamily)
MNKAIYFDMDGTLANLYGVDNWLAKLRAFDASPYEDAEVMLNMQALAHRLNKLKANGYTIGIISWLSKESNKEYDKAIIEAKKKWLKKHLGSVEFDEITFTKYGRKKSRLAAVKNGILFDDNEKVRRDWIRHNPNGWAFAEKHILEILEELSCAYNKFQ